MTCPDCGAKISTKHFDPELSMYECPKCENIFTPDELEEAANGTSPAKRSRDGEIVGRARKAASVAKGKKRRTQIEEDDEALKEFEKTAYQPVKLEPSKKTKHRDEIPSGQVVTTMAAELQTIYAEMGVNLDDVNAHDKALTIWRVVHFQDGVTAREKTLNVRLCKEHG